MVHAVEPLDFMALFHCRSIVELCGNFYHFIPWACPKYFNSPSYQSDIYKLIVGGQIPQSGLV